MNSNHRPAASDDARRIRWTAYALDQLDAVERREVESELAASDEARQFVADIQSLAGQVRGVAQQESSALEPSAALAEALEERLSQTEVAQMKVDLETPDQRKLSPAVKTRSLRGRWLVAAGAACLVAVVPAYQYLARESHSGGPREVAKNDSPASMRKAKVREYGDAEFVAGQMAAGRNEHSENMSGTIKTVERPSDAFSNLTTRRAERYSSMDLGSRTVERDPHASAAPTPIEKARLRTYLRPINKLIREQQRIPGQGEPGPSPEPKPEPCYTIAKPVYETQGKRPVTPPVSDPKSALTFEFRGQETTSSESDENTPNDNTCPSPSIAEGRTLGTEQYERIIENAFLPVAEQPQSTFSIDVDTASYANVRRFLTQNMWPPADAVRIEEMVNYFRYDYPLPNDDVPFSVDMEVAQCPWNSGNRLLRVGLKGDEIDRQNRGLSNLVFLLDVSGSMSDQNKLPLVKQAMRLLVEQLDENDRVAIVTYAGTTGVHLESTNGQHRQQIIEAIERLSPGGSTNGGAGIKLAYQQAVRYFLKEGTNRVILCTDGDLNVGITRDDDLVKLIKKKAASGVFLTVLGFGTGNLKDAKLEKLADRGNGIYAYIDSLREAQKVLVEQLTGSLITIAKDVKLQIEFNPAEVAAYRLIGYENRVMAARDFHDDKKDAGEIGAGHTVTALYELVPAQADSADAGPSREAKGDTSGKFKYQRGPAVRLTKAAENGELLTLSLRYKQPDAQKSQLLEFTARDSDKRIGQASKDFQFASAVAAFGMILRGSQHRGQATLSAVEEIAASAIGDDPGGYRAEMVDLVRRAKQIQR